MQVENNIGFGLSEIKQEGGNVIIDRAYPSPEETIPSQWMELNIPDNWTEEQIIKYVKEWIKEERFYGRTVDEVEPDGII